MEYHNPANQIYKKLDSQEQIFEERHQRAAQMEEERQEAFLAQQREKADKDEAKPDES